MTAEELFKRIIDIQQNTYHQSLETERMIIEDECVKLINDNFIPIKGSRMKEETKILLTKLFRKYQTIGAASGTAYLTEQDYNFLIHDESFPVDRQVLKKIAGIEFRPSIDNIDEIIADNCSIHLECLDKDLIWMSIELPNGDNYHINIYHKDNKCHKDLKISGEKAG